MFDNRNIPLDTTTTLATQIYLTAPTPLSGRMCSFHLTLSPVVLENSKMREAAAAALAAGLEAEMSTD